MSTITLIDYGCHSFSYRLAARLHDYGLPTRYFVNGSLESPNLSSLPQWVKDNPDMVRNITCKRPYGKLSLARRLRGESDWAIECLKALEQENPAAVIVSCLPLTVASRIESWCNKRAIPFVYWLQDIQGKAISDLLTAKLGWLGRLLGGLASKWEQHLLTRSRMVITIAPSHERELPLPVLKQHRYRLLENWGNLEDFPKGLSAGEWASQYGLDQTVNVMYTGTLGLKHDLHTFFDLAVAFKDRPDIRIVIVSSGQAADKIRIEAARKRIHNLVVLPFQPHAEVPTMLASAAVLVAPLNPSAGSFCVPSKILSYLCSGRPTVIAIDPENLAAKTILRSQSGLVVRPGDSKEFIKAVARLIDDPAFRLEAGSNARAYAEVNFNIDTIMETFIGILADSGVSLTPQVAAKAIHDLAQTAATV